MKVNWLFNPCRRWRRELTLQAGGLLPDKQRPLVQAHLAGCTRCRRYQDELSRLAAGLRSLSRSSPAVEPPAALRARWRRAVRGTPQTGSFSETAGALVAARLAFLRRLAWAGLAGVWLLIGFFRVTLPPVSEVASPSAAPAPRDIYLALRHPDWPRIELADARANPSAEERKPNPPKPRSHRRPGARAA